MTTKRCSKCQQDLTLDSFTRNRSRIDGLEHYCRECKKLAKISSRYGITETQYLGMLADQDGKCAICEQRPEQEPLVVDHNHDTGEVRGLLCSSCNKALGLMYDSPKSLLQAALYVM